MRWLLRYAARTTVRRLIWLAVAAVLAALGVGTARAQSACPLNGSCDEGVAYAMAWSAAAKGAETTNAANPSETRPGFKWEPRVMAGGSAGNQRSYRAYMLKPIPGVDAGCSSIPGACDFYFGADKTCSARNTNALADAAPWYTEPSKCIGGCAVQGTSFSHDNAGLKVYGMRDRTYTGGTCSPTNPSQDIQHEKDDTQEATKPKQPECNALGSGQTACKKPNGDYCATASTGKSFCWQPTETGKKIDGTDAQVKSKQGEPVTPPSVKIDDKDWQRKEGHQATACINNTCVNYNVTNYQTVPAGSSKNSTGDNKADGTGNTSGNGAPQKDGDNGEKDDGDSASDSGNCEVPPACTGDTLKCLHLRYTWKIECNSRSSEVTKGDGCGTNDVPACVGSSCKAETYSLLLQQWKQRCALRALGNAFAGTGEPAGTPDSVWQEGPKGDGMTFRRDLINVGGGGSLLPTGITIEGQAWEVPQGFYDAISAIRLLVISCCTIMAMFIAGRSI